MSALSSKLAEALSRRSPLLNQFEAFRLVDGVGDDLPSLFIDKFGPVALAHLHEAASISPTAIESALKSAPWSGVGVTTVYLRIHRRASKETAESSPSLVMGPATEKFKISEHGVSYFVNPSQQVNAGLFLDMREVRERLIRESVGKKILNLFCFTGSLGISAYVGKANFVTQVDSSKSALSWGKENLELNESEEVSGEIKFISEDAFAFVSRECRRGGARYDRIIIDPPSFGRSKKGTFSFTDNAGTLVAECISILKSGGDLILTTNKRDFDTDDVLQIVHEQAKTKGRRLSSHQLLLPPASDFTASGEDSIAMKGIWAVVS